MLLLFSQVIFNTSLLDASAIALVIVDTALSCSSLCLLRVVCIAQIKLHNLLPLLLRRLSAVIGQCVFCVYFVYVLNAFLRLYNYVLQAVVSLSVSGGRWVLKIRTDLFLAGWRRKCLNQA